MQSRAEKLTWAHRIRKAVGHAAMKLNSGKPVTKRQKEKAAAKITADRELVIAQPVEKEVPQRETQKQLNAESLKNQDELKKQRAEREAAKQKAQENVPAGFQLLNNDVLKNRPKQTGKRLPTKALKGTVDQLTQNVENPQPKPEQPKPVVSPVINKPSLIQRVRAKAIAFVKKHPILAALILGTVAFIITAAIVAAVVFSGGLAPIGGAPLLALAGGGLAGQIAATVLLTTAILAAASLLSNIGIGIARFAKIIKKQLPLKQPPLEISEPTLSKINGILYSKEDDKLVKVGTQGKSKGFLIVTQVHESKAQPVNQAYKDIWVERHKRAAKQDYVNMHAAYFANQPKAKKEEPTINNAVENGPANKQ